jgi:hypothetical protein
MTHAIQQIGAVAGLASFLGLALLAFLYFSQARHVRDLEDKATFVPDDLDLPATAPPAAEAAKVATPAAPATRKERKAAATAEAQLAAARQTEVARAAAERRARFQERRGGGPLTAARGAGGTAGNGGGLSQRRMPEPRAMIVIGLGVLVLVAGVVFGASRLLSSDNGTSSGGGGAASSQGTGAPVEVAVLNGTPVSGLAAKIGEQVRSAGSYKLGSLTNTETPFTVTTVMFDPADPKAQAHANTLAGQLQVGKIEPMSGEVKKLAQGAPVVVVVGEDRAGT